MTLSIEDIRAKLKAQQEKRDNRSPGGDNSIYPFWNIPEGSNAVLRFLPDNDPDNDFFWVERLTIKIPFPGIKGESDRETIVTVPCMDMWKETDPILAETRPWWKDQELIPLARKYWKKKSYIFQGFVVSNPMEEESVPTNPIRRFVINPSIFDIIKASLMDPDMEDLPIDYVNGRDFKLIKTSKGSYANYASSSWSIRSRALTESELSAVNEFGLFNLKDYLPKKPTAEEQEIIKEMFHASVNGEQFDTEKFGKYYRPNGFNNFSGTSVVQETDEEVSPTVSNTSPKITVPSGAATALASLKSKVQPKVVEEEEVAKPAPVVNSEKKLSADELLEMIRSRKTK